MTAIISEGDRNVIPRWRSIAATYLQGELNPLGVAARPDWLDRTEALERLEHDWLETRSLSFASDFVGAALVLGQEERAQQAAEYVMEAADAPATAVAAAERDVAGGDAPLEEPEPPSMETRQVEIRSRIALLKAQVRESPRNALRWAELARLYTIAGEHAKATDSMRTSITLAPADRFVLRSAARLWIHHSEPDRAHQLLVRAGATPQDPWLVAAEIAVAGAAKASPRFVRIAREMMESGQYGPLHTTELASALGTLELHGDRLKRARRFFAASLSDPTENSVAQVQWASRQSGEVEFDPAYLERQRSHEAEAWIHAGEGDWRGALNQAWLWQEDQPFASGPGEFGSYQAAMGQQFEAGAAIGKAALVANPGEFLLLNNVSFCLFSADSVEEGDTYFRQIRESELTGVDALTYSATAGLREYRLGNVDEGRRLYEKAINDAPDATFRAIAYLMWLREEGRAGAPVPLDAVERVAEPALERSRDIELWLDHVRAAQRRTRFAFRGLDDR